MRALTPWLLIAALLPVDTALAADTPPTREDAEAFLLETETRLLELMVARERASWVQDNFVTPDTEAIAAEAAEDLMAFISEVAPATRRFDGVDLAPDQKRKMELLRLWIDLPAPRDPTARAELAAISARMQSMYASGRYCPPRLEGKCVDLEVLSDVLAHSQDWDELQEAWVGWRTISPAMRQDYMRFVQLANAGAIELGEPDVGALWRSRYEMSPEALAAEADRLWGQVKPLYQELHCYARRKLSEKHGKDRVPPDGLIPAHLLGNMWAQDWSALYPLLAPPRSKPADLDAAIVAKGWDAQAMARQAEAFFVSLGFQPLPQTFWERSLFVKPADRTVVCHASAWDVDFDRDLRIKMCIRPTFEDFTTIHHELGHVYYYDSVRQHSALFRDDPMDAFNEAIGDTISLSVTPEYLVRLGLIQEVPEDDIDPLLRRALDAVAFLPFGLMVDRWRWDVFQGGTSPDAYNTRWWALARTYQGIAPPVPRTEADFDPGAKYHIPANVPYLRYFFSSILQYQFHRALCKEAGFKGPLHECSIHGNEAAGKKLRAMLEMGATRPWPEAMQAMTGETRMDAGAMLEYYAPLRRWLREQNRASRCGW